MYLRATRCFTSPPCMEASRAGRCGRLCRATTEAQSRCLERGFAHPRSQKRTRYCPVQHTHEVDVVRSERDGSRLSGRATPVQRVEIIDKEAAIRISICSAVTR